jgi:hypothetical protein
MDTCPDPVTVIPLPAVTFMVLPELTILLYELAACLHCQLSPSGLVPMKILALSAPVMSLRQSKISCFVCSSSTTSARLKHILQLTCDHEVVACQHYMLTSTILPCNVFRAKEP